MYGVKIGDNRFIAWCDNCWYETTKSPNITFTKEKALNIVKQLLNHYVYKSTIVDNDGNEEVFDVIAEIKSKRQLKNDTIDMVDDCFEM